MTYIFYSIICICLIVVQTVVIPEIAGFQVAYDLLLVFVFYLALFRPTREALVVVLMIAFVMDNLSGAPFGLCVGVVWYRHSDFCRGAICDRHGDLFRCQKLRVVRFGISRMCEFNFYGIP